MDTFFNYIFVCLKDHKWNIIIWIIIIFLVIFSINCKVYILKVWHKLKMFLYVLNIQTSRVNNPWFFQTSFFSTKCASFLLRMKRILTLMIRKAKGFELIIFFITNLSTFGSKVLLTLKIMDFENVPSTKVVHFYVIKDVNA